MGIQQRIQACLQNQDTREHIIPFFWQHGESHARLEEEINAIAAANIRQFCVESRVHEQFGEEKWWEDMGFILQEAKKRGMRVWMLDDKYFPSGYAAGYVLKHPELRKTLIRMDWRDFTGPRRNVHTLPVQLGEDEEFVSIVAFRRPQKDFRFAGQPLDLMPGFRNGLLHWDIPEGAWRVYFIIRTHETVEPEWIDPMNPESCKAMLTAVYEPHYAHFKEYFGNTFAGFFSDEPRFGNDWKNYETRLGKMYIPLPWRDDMPERLAAATGLTPHAVRCLLPALFHTYEEESIHTLRCHYMDICSKQYRDNYCRLLGDWCVAHNVEYIGHVIEDMNAHQRMGFGAGHFFRALEGQTMGGMDIVLHQIVPGMLDTDHTGPVDGKVLDPEFFHYLLGKLPTSQAHTNPRMQGRAMCEIYGAFGWAEGIPHMKQLTDHMLANGINYFVPHAFSPKYPDRDAPPHFYAGGHNPQFEAFGCLMRYMNRSAHLITGGIHRAPVAVLYNPEAEWAGGENIMLQKVGKVLTRRQIDFDILSEDILGGLHTENGLLFASRESYRALIVPESEYLTSAMIQDLTRLAEAGLPVIVAGGFRPKACEDGTVLENCEVIPLQALCDYLTDRGFYDIMLQPAQELVHYYRMQHDDGECFIFFSEDVYHPARFTVQMPEDREYRVYDPWRNKLYTPLRNGKELELYLPQAGMLFVITSDAEAEAFDTCVAQGREAALKVEVSVDEGACGKFRPLDAAIGQDITAMDGMDRFAGVICYEGTITLQKEDKLLCLGEVGEIAQVWLNGVDLGRTVCMPYTVELQGVREGSNRIRIDVINNLGYRERDHFSSYLSFPPSGLMGPVTVR